MEERKPNLVEHALKFGLIMGLVSIVIQLGIYVINKEWLVSVVLGFISFAITITLVVYPIRVYRQQNGGVVSFKEAFVIGFIVFAGSSLLTSVFQYALYNFIDPDLSEYIKEKAIEKVASITEKIGGSQDDIEKAVEQLEREDFSQSPKRLASNFLGGILSGSVISLIIAAFTRKKPKTQDIE